MTHKYAVTISINYKNRCFLIVRDIRYRKVISFIIEECFIEINVRSLRKILCNRSRFISYHLIIFISLSNKNSFLFLSELRSVSIVSFHVFQSEHFLHSIMILGSGSLMKFSAMTIEKHMFAIVVLRSYTSSELVYLMDIYSIPFDAS
jgi:hypothetical protein